MEESGVQPRRENFTNTPMKVIKTIIAYKISTKYIFVKQYKKRLYTYICTPMSNVKKLFFMAKLMYKIHDVILTY